MSAEQVPDSRPLPQAVEIGFDRSVRELWIARTRQHFEDSYAGASMLQFPEDLRVFEHLLWQARPDTVIEIGTQGGGSALWYRDRLRTLARYGGGGAVRVISIDIEPAPAREALERADPSFEQEIELIHGDVLDPELPARVQRLLPDCARCMVVEDSAHVYETTRAALEGFSRFVAPGGFFVVEDGCVDVEEMRLSDDWPRGVLPAVADWLRTEQGSSFVVRRDLELYGISCHPGGFLQRTAR